MIIEDDDMPEAVTPEATTAPTAPSDDDAAPQSQDGTDDATPDRTPDSETTEGEEEQTTEAEDDLPKGVRQLQKRVHRLTAQKHELVTLTQRQANALAEAEEQLAKLRAAQPDDFETDADYQRAIARELRLEERIGHEKAAQQQRVEMIDSIADTSIEQQVEAARQDIPDIEREIYAEDAPISSLVKHICADSDVGVQMLYHLVKTDRQLGEKLYRLSSNDPIAVARELGSLEGRLQARAKAKTPTRAPAPPAQARTSPATVAFDPATADMDDYVKWYRERRRGR